MRTIKFRGKRLDNSEWVYGDLLRMHGVPYIYPDPAPDGWNDYEVIPDTVGQFTGLLDKNGKEIYEGDIIISEDYEHAKHYIGYREDDAMFVAYIVATRPLDFFAVRQDWLDVTNKIVIGNIHDNPELLTLNK